jgi:hypothetical protein
VHPVLDRIAGIVAVASAMSVASGGRMVSPDFAHFADALQ